jgi:uncharacterized protein (DUF2235 family)
MIRYNTRKRFVFLFDGTGASAASRSQRETNVFRMNRALTFHTKLSFYFSGVGTRRDFLALASGAGLDEIIREAYVNLASNYQPGDELYLFGWSRGAFAARVFAGLISKSGLILCDGLKHFRWVWEYFLLDTSLSKNEERAAKLLHILKNNRLPWDEQPRIKFLGLFDCVKGSYWPYLQRRFTEANLLSSELEELVDYGFQLLSIDDSRIPSFTPALWKKAGSHQKCDQVWMPGVHADVGGGSGAFFLNNVALLTMIGVAAKHCNLKWDPNRIDDAKMEVSRHRFEISSERSDVGNELLLSGKRAIAETQYCNQWMHPILQDLIDKPVTLRGELTNYRPNNVYGAALSLKYFSVPNYEDILRCAARQAVR